MSEKKKLIPELRFPEFVDEGEWEEKKLGNYIDLFSGIALKSEEISDDESGIPILRGINITEGYIRHSKDIDKFYLGEIENLNKYYIKEKDIVIGMDGSKVGKNVALIGKEDENSLLIQRVARIRAYENADIHFVYQYFISDKFRNYVDKVNTSSGIPHISAQQIKDFRIGIPPKLVEQQKNASCLSSLDEIITAQSQKLDLLKDHKKGLMQNLFPQEGKKVPKYRFKEFENGGEWVEKKLGEVADFINGRAYKQEELLAKGKYRVLRVGNFFTNNEWYYSNLELDDDKYCDKGDLLYAWSASFGPHIWNEEKVIYHYHIWKVNNKKGINRNFLFNLLDFETFRMKAKSLNGFALMHITKGTIENWESMIPKTEKEQQKIASCLSSLDDLIAAQTAKIDQLKLHKKGLMQGLFPKIND